MGFNKNKKAIMVKFLVTLLLAMIIFAPACLISSKFLRLSSQAKANFGDFAEKLKELVAAPDGTKDNLMLIMDEETAIVGFSQGQTKVKSCIKFTVTSYEDCGIWQAPDVEECEGSSCVCLIQEIISVRNKVKKVLPGLREVEYGSAVCKKVEGVIFDTPYLKIEREKVSPREFEYFNKNGFVLGRNIPNFDIYMMIEKFNFKDRRNLIHLMKKEGKVFVCWEGQCKDLSEKITGE